MEPIKGGSLASLPQDVTEMFKAYHPDVTLASWALRYVGTLPGVKVILSGMSTLAQVEEWMYRLCILHAMSIWSEYSI